MNNEQNENEFSLKSLFIPFTKSKAIHWTIIIGLIIYANILFNNFLWDDNTYIIQNPYAHTIDLIRDFSQSSLTQGYFYRPISSFYFSTVYTFFHETPFFYHFFQIIFHVLNTILLFLIFKKFFNLNLSFFLALVFLVHPIQVESVAFIAATSNPLYFLFGCLALYLSDKNKLNTKLKIIIFSLLFLSLLSKEVGILFIFIVLLFRILFKKKNVAIFAASSALIVGFYLILRFAASQAYHPKIMGIPIAELPLVERVLNIPAIFLYYIKLFFYPANLAINQQWVISGINFNNFYFPLIILMIFCILICLLGFRVFKNREEFFIYLFFLVWFLSGMAMIIQVIPLEMTVADRWFYFPVVGLLGLIGLSLQQFNINKKAVIVVCIIGFLIIATLSTRTVIRNTNWSNAISLYSNDIKIEDNFDTRNNLGAELVLTGNVSEAIKHYKKSIEYYPYDINYANLGYAYQLLNDKESAMKYYSLALKANGSGTNNHPYEVYSYPIEYLLKLKEFSNAEKILNEAVKDYPNDSQLWLYLAYAEYKINNYDDAVSAAETAYYLQQSYATTFVYQKIKDKQPLDINLNDGK